jgi:hypothetical protein
MAGTPEIPLDQRQDYESQVSSGRIEEARTDYRRAVAALTSYVSENPDGWERLGVLQFRFERETDEERETVKLEMMKHPARELRNRVSETMTNYYDLLRPSEEGEVLE